MAFDGNVGGVEGVTMGGTTVEGGGRGLADCAVMLFTVLMSSGWVGNLTIKQVNRQSCKKAEVEILTKTIVLLLK